MQVVEVKKIIIPIFVILMIGLVFAQDICDTCMIEDPAMCPPECFGAGLYGDNLLDDPLLNNPSNPGPVCGDNILDEIEECETNSDCGANEECIGCICALIQGDIGCSQTGCSESYICVNNICVEEVECETDNDCDTDYKCENNVCVLSETQPECDENNSCEEGKECVENICVVKENETEDNLSMGDLDVSGQTEVSEDIIKGKTLKTILLISILIIIAMIIIFVYNIIRLKLKGE